METMTGIPARDMLGKGNYEYALPFYGERRPLLVDMVLSADEEIALRYAKIQRRGDVLFGETNSPRLGDRKENIYLAGTAAPLYDSQGNLVGAIESIRDITERKRAEEALRYRDAILEVASFAAERFLKAPSWEKDIREILARLGTVTNVSRVYIFENRISEEGALLSSQRYEWVSDGIKPEIDNPALQDFSLEREGFGRWVDIMRKGGRISTVPSGKPPKKAKEKSWHPRTSFPLPPCPSIAATSGGVSWGSMNASTRGNGPMWRWRPSPWWQAP